MRNRKQRIPFGKPRMVLNVDDKTIEKVTSQGKVLRWFNGEDDRIERALDGGWEFVNLPGVKTGDTEEVQDRRIKKRVGRDLYAFLMAIPKEFYDEDQTAKEERNMMVDDAIRGGRPDGVQPHNVSDRDGGAYVKGINYKP